MTQDNTDFSIQLADDIRHYLQANKLAKNMPNITYEILALQLIDCIKQVKTLKAINSIDISAESANPQSPKFDPIKAIFLLKETDCNEACWLSFLLTYTDDSEQTDWAFMRLIYSGVDPNLQTPLTWQVLNDNPSMLTDRLNQLAESLAATHPKPKFGKHRAYESLSHLPIVFNSYISFINEQGGHKALFTPQNNVSKTEHFAVLYDLVRQNVYRFGRLSTFEYLCLLGVTGLANIDPDSCYISEASGPKRGAKLLFGMLDNPQLDGHAQALADDLDVGYQEMEAALCQWQKSPNRYIKHD